ncbi:MAG: class I SAM-dependent methyltransferase [Puniceicoccales bacterium]|jgi:methylation protein EvaC|nr:class I SAM-dependent methyltransferase [Puniceicoccales bacterium]
MCCFFNDITAEEIKQSHGKADLISVANVHFPNINEVAKGVAMLLKDNGVFVFENPYLGNVIKNVAYDQIYDEHSFIFGLNSVSYVFRREGFEVFRVEAQETHGGSMRYYLCNKGTHGKNAHDFSPGYTALCTLDGKTYTIELKMHELKK